MAPPDSDPESNDDNNGVEVAEALAAFGVVVAEVKAGLDVQYLVKSVRLRPHQKITPPTKILCKGIQLIPEFKKNLKLLTDT